MDDSSSASMLNSMNISYLVSVDNLLEKFAWIEVRGTPGLALIRLGMTIDLYFLQSRRIIRCAGLPGPVTIDAGRHAFNILPYATSASSDSDDDYDSSDLSRYGDLIANRDILKCIRFGWSYKTKCLTLCYVNDRPSRITDCNTLSSQIVIKNFGVKL